MTPDKPPALPQLPPNIPAPPVPGSQPLGTKPGAKPQTNLSWLNTKTGKAAGDPTVGSASGSAPGGKQLTGQ